MTLQELKIWINNLPENFLEYQVSHAEVIGLDTDSEVDEEKIDYTIRLDKPITALSVDEDNKEILIMSDYDEDQDLEGKEFMEGK
jgi:hypothetical protein